MSRGSGVGPARWPHGGLHSIVATTSTGAGTAYALGGAFGVFGLQCTTGHGFRLEGSINGSDYVVIGAATAWTTAQAAGLVQVKSSAPVTHIRLRLTKHATAGRNANGWVSALPAKST